MRRGVALYLVGSALLVTLAGCGRWLSFEQRDPWRREAEAACVKSGAVKPSAAVAQVRAIDGPGICGAEYPFKVGALGGRTILGYASTPRPPAAIPQGFPIPPPQPAAVAAPRYDDPYRPGAGSAGPDQGPLSIHPPGAEPVEEEPPQTADEGSPPQGAPSANGDPAVPPMTYPSRERELPSLGPSRGQTLAVSAAAVAPTATLACPLVSRLDQWMANAVQPAAQRWFGQQVAEIKQISSYSCRGMNGQRGAPISEHAFGNALDIAAFTLADGRRVTVKGGWRGAPEEQGFLRDVHASACEYFSTVLAPGSNRFHYDHIHVDLARRRSGRHVCNPKAVPGDLIARRAADRLVTGSIGRAGRMGFASEGPSDSGLRVTLPRAIPGED